MEDTSLERVLSSEVQNASFFANASNVVISGGSFTSHVHQTVQRQPLPDFRNIPLGEIELRNELATNSWRHPKFYAARIKTRRVTIALYSEEDGAEKELRFATLVRHPNLLQLFGGYTGEHIHAAVYHGDLMSLLDLWRSYRTSPLSRVKLIHQWSIQFWDAAASIQRALDHPVLQVKFSFFFCKATGQLSLRIDDTIEQGVYSSSTRPPRIGSGQREGFKDLYSACECSRPESDSGPSSWTRIWKRRTWGSITVGSWAVALRPTSFSTVATLRRQPLYYIRPWANESRPCGPIAAINLEELPSGWTRFTASAFRFTGFHMIRVSISRHNESKFGLSVWASQATNLRRRLTVAGRSPPYALIKDLCIHVSFKIYPEHLMPNFAHAHCFFAPPSTAFSPDTPLESIAYWSMHPDGGERLGTTEAQTLHLPKLSIYATVGGLQYPDDMYDEFDAIHRSKGFDPESTDVARHLGLPIFESTVNISRPGMRRVDFFDADWEDGDDSIACLFVVEDEFPDPNNSTCAPGLTVLHIGLILLGFGFLVLGY